MAGRQETRSPQSRIEGLAAEASIDRRVKHDERRKILIHAAQPVRHPRAGTGPPRNLTAGLNVSDRRVVIDGFRIDGSNHGQVVDHSGGVRQELADPRSVGTVLIEFKERRRDRKSILPRGHRRDPLAVADRVWQVLVEPLVELRLVIPHVQLRGSTRHKQVDASLWERSAELPAPVASPDPYRLGSHRRDPD